MTIERGITNKKDVKRLLNRFTLGATLVAQIFLTGSEKFQAKASELIVNPHPGLKEAFVATTIKCTTTSRNGKPYGSIEVDTEGAEATLAGQDQTNGDIIELMTSKSDPLTDDYKLKSDTIYLIGPGDYTLRVKPTEGYDIPQDSRSWDFTIEPCQK